MLAMSLIKGDRKSAGTDSQAGVIAPVPATPTALEQILVDSRAALNGVTDEASARAALPTLQTTQMRLDSFSTSFGELSNGEREPIKEVAREGLSAHWQLTDQIMKNADVKAVLDTALTPFSMGLQNIAEEK